MNLFQVWFNLDTPTPLAIIFYKECEYDDNFMWNLDSCWTWEGTPEELHSEFGLTMYNYSVIDIQKEESGYTIWITNKENKNEEIRSVSA